MSVQPAGVTPSSKHVCVPSAHSSVWTHETPAVCV